MAGSSCFHALRIRRSKSKPLPDPSSSKTKMNSDMENLERKRFDSLESWSMILDSENVETWEPSKEDQDEWTADFSQLFIGNKFASGAHSRIYRGIYKQRAVAVKMVRIPNQNEETRTLLEQQFKSEVALLSRLFHPNIVQVRFLTFCLLPYRYYQLKIEQLFVQNGMLKFSCLIYILYIYYFDGVLTSLISKLQRFLNRSVKLSPSFN